MQKSKTYIIAEAGVNHNGNEKIALALLEKAYEAGADCIKYQTFKADLLCNQSTTLAEYQARNTRYAFQVDMLQALELPYEMHFTLKQEAENKKIDFLSTPFDFVSLQFLTEDLGLKTLKISSADLSNTLLLYKSAYQQVKIILSTGMARLGDIELALASLAWGYNKLKYPKSVQELLGILEDRSTYRFLSDKVCILHCTSSYPASMEDINLTVIETLKTAFQCKVGYSDHSLGTEVPIAAIALGAEIIEKHFTLDKKMEGPDHAASLDCHELTYMVKSIRNIEKALGTSWKYRLKIEREVYDKTHKRILAAETIRKGQEICLDNLMMKRNTIGITANNLWDVIGRVAEKDYEKGDPI